MSLNLTHSLNAIAIQDAEATAAKLATKGDALRMLTQARTDNDTALVNAVRKQIDLNRPSGPQADYIGLLTTDNVKIQKVLTEHKVDSQMQALQVNAASGKITLAYRDEQYHNLVAQHGWVEQLDLLVTNAETATAPARARLRTLITKLMTPRGTIEEQLLAETRSTKAWGRMKSDLDLMEPSAAFAQVMAQLSDTNDPVLRTMVMTEAPAYLRSRGYTDVDEALNEALIVSDPALSAARREKQAADEYVQIVGANVRFAKGRLDGGIAPSLEAESMYTFSQSWLVRQLIPATPTSFRFSS